MTATSNNWESKYKSDFYEKKKKRKKILKRKTMNSYLDEKSIFLLQHSFENKGYFSPKTYLP